MNTQTALHQAILAAKQQNWQSAIEYNELILAEHQTDLGALNRLGIAHIQLGDKAKAKAAFNKALDIDKSNSIAKKNLQRLQQKSVKIATFSNQDFIEEPGKSKTLELHRLAGKQVLDDLAVGQLCELKSKSRYISIESQGQYIGALPEDISFRLSKLVEAGNIYSCCIRSFSPSHCSIYIRETFRSEKNAHIHSFPLVKSHLATVNEVDDELMIDDHTVSGYGLEEAEVDERDEKGGFDPE